MRDDQAKRAVRSLEVTPAMIEAGVDAMHKTYLDRQSLVTAVYRAMRLARPLSEGPGV